MGRVHFPPRLKTVLAGAGAGAGAGAENIALEYRRVEMPGTDQLGARQSGVDHRGAEITMKLFALNKVSFFTAPQIGDSCWRLNWCQ